MSAFQPRWIGRVKAVSPTDIAKVYWETDIPIAEIIEAYAPHRHTSEIASIAGRGTIYGEYCKICKRELVVTSRSDAEQRLRYKERRHSTFFDGFVCADCNDIHRKQVQAECEQKHAAQRHRESELRFMPYRDYLQTPEWKDRAAHAKRQAQYRCQTCASGGELHVHHRTYANRGREAYRDLTVLCSACHKLFHDHGRLAENGRAVGSALQTDALTAQYRETLQ